MSRDLRLKHICPHRVVQEWLSIDAEDLQTLRPVRDPSAGNVEIYVNGVETPREGVLSGIGVSSLKRGPYSIVSGYNDRIALLLNNELLQYTLPAGNRLSVTQVCSSLQAQQGVDDRIRFSVDRERLRVDTRDQGSQVTLFFQDGSGHATLGLPTNRFFRGRTAIPGWSLVKDPMRPLDPRARIISFDRPFSSDSDIFEVNYTTEASQCPRCQSLRIEDDIRYDTLGEPEWATGTALLLQEVQKIVLTIKGSNVFHQWYGTSISSLIGSKIFNGGSALEAQLVQEISQALQRYRDIKDQQSALQVVTDAEFLQRVTQLQVVQDSVDPTIFYISIGLQSRSTELTVYEESLKLQGELYNGALRVR